MSNYMKAELLPKIGDSFGLWVVVYANTIWCMCRCICGKEKEVRTRNLIDNKSTKCRSCAAKTQGTKLWDSTQPIKLRNAVKAAIERCTDESHQAYHNYGGRGIKVHQEWLDDPRLFVTYLATLSGCNDHKLLLDRANNDGHYEPGNLRFTTRSESSSNQRVRREGCRRRFFRRKTK